MNERLIRITAAIGLILGGMFGLAGSFAPTDILRVLAWNIDGVALTIACSLLAIYYFRKELVITAIGFLIFAIGECFILASNGIHLQEHGYTFGTGVSLWAVSLGVISSQRTFPVLVRCTGVLVSILFSIVAVLIFANHAVHPLTKPLPFFAYPFFVMTIVGWAWSIIKEKDLAQGTALMMHRRRLTNA